MNESNHHLLSDSMSGPKERCTLFSAAPTRLLCGQSFCSNVQELLQKVLNQVAAGERTVGIPFLVPFCFVASREQINADIVLNLKMWKKLQEACLQKECRHVLFNVGVRDKGQQGKLFVLFV